MHLSIYVSKTRYDILKYKFKDKRELAKMYALGIFSFPTLLSTLSKYRYIAYVPLSRKKEKLRGYNQSKLFAKELGKLLNIPVLDCIEKIKDNKRQSSVKREERAKNVKDVFKIDLSEIEENLKIDGHENEKIKILLVDDILTTGSTIVEIVNKMRENESFKDKKIICDAFVIARGLNNKRG